MWLRVQAKSSSAKTPVEDPQAQAGARPQRKGGGGNLEGCQRDQQPRHQQGEHTGHTEGQGGRSWSRAPPNTTMSSPNLPRPTWTLCRTPPGGTVAETTI